MLPVLLGGHPPQSSGHFLSITLPHLPTRSLPEPSLAWCPPSGENHPLLPGRVCPPESRFRVCHLRSAPSVSLLCILLHSPAHGFSMSCTTDLRKRTECHQPWAFQWPFLIEYFRAKQHKLLLTTLSRSRSIGASKFPQKANFSLRHIEQIKIEIFKVAELREWIGEYRGLAGNGGMWPKWCKLPGISRMSAARGL